MAGECYNLNTTITIITTIIISVLLGTISPITSPGVNIPLETGKKLYSQIIKASIFDARPSTQFNKLSALASKLDSTSSPQVQKKSLNEVNPLESLGNVTAPLDSIFKVIGDRIGGLDHLKELLGINNTVISGRSKSSLLSGFDSGDTSGAGQVMGILKSGLILVVNIFLAVLKVVTSIIKAILGLVS